MCGFIRKRKKFVSGKVWRDTEGNVINAHGGGVLYHEGKYYWFGEHRPESGFVTEKRDQLLFIY